LQQVNLSYNIRGLITSINNPSNLNDDYFAMNINYETGDTKQYNGNISAIDWASKNFSNIKTYQYSYDGLNRLKTADYSIDNNYSSSYNYDFNGNITSLTHNGMIADSSFAEIDNLSYTYNGNQLLSVNDADLVNTNFTQNGFEDKGSIEEIEYIYDANGNMIKDLNKEILNVDYNKLNLPQSIELDRSTSMFIKYTYDAAGNKLQKRTDVTTDYCGSFVYKNGLLKYILIDYGLIVVNDSIFTRNYNLKDHLGNVRVTFDDTGKILQENSYYAFGMTMNGLTYIDNNISDEETNKYLYNGKELQTDFDLGWYDYCFRMYNTQIASWQAVDAMTNFYHSSSPYAYVRNNPIALYDPNGLWDDDYNDADYGGDNDNRNDGWNDYFNSFQDVYQQNPNDIQLDPVAIYAERQDIFERLSYEFDYDSYRDNPYDEQDIYRRENGDVLSDINNSLAFVAGGIQMQSAKYLTGRTYERWKAGNLKLSRLSTVQRDMLSINTSAEVWSKRFFWIGVGLSFNNVINGEENLEQGGLDVAVGALGTWGGPYGFGISMAYFIITFLPSPRYVDYVQPNVHMQDKTYVDIRP